MEDRLAKIESSIALLLETMSEEKDEHVRSQQSISEQVPRHILPPTPQISPGLMPPPRPKKKGRKIGHHQTIRDVCGAERYYGSTSLTALVHELDQNSLRHLPSDEYQTPTWGSVRTVRQSIKALSETNDHMINEPDGSTLSRPPLAILEAMIPQFFDSVNTYLPIWSRETFRQLVTSAYHEQNYVEERAHAICFNNLILLTLTARSNQGQACHASQPGSRTAGLAIDLDLTKPLLENAERAFQNLELLLSPRFTNVQALLSLVSTALLRVPELNVLL
jgi:hypothetical protein